MYNEAYGRLVLTRGQERDRPSTPHIEMDVRYSEIIRESVYSILSQYMLLKDGKKLNVKLLTRGQNSEEGESIFSVEIWISWMSRVFTRPSTPCREGYPITY